MSVFVDPPMRLRLRNDLTWTRREAEAGRMRLNGTAVGANASIIGNACCRTKGLWSRLRLNSLIPLALGACVLLPATSSALQTKELSMQDNKGQYQPYTPGMKLPDGVFPPMPGYTHKELLAAAHARTEDFLKAKNIEPGLIRETLIALDTHLVNAFEKEGVEYQIATWYQKPYDSPDLRKRSIDNMAEQFGALALEAAAESLDGSQLLLQGKAFYGDFMSESGDAVSDLILTLNKH